MGNLYLARHGQTDHNLQKMYQGTGLHIPLNRQGHLDAIRLRDMFTGVNIDRLFVSPALRTRQTAQPIIEAKGLEMVVHDDLKEKDHGPLNDTSFAHIKDIYQYIFEGEGAYIGESIKQVFSRASKEGDTLVRMATTEDVLVISHGVLLSTMMIHFEGKELAYHPEDHLKNCRVHHYQVSDTGRLSLIGLNLAEIRPV